MHTAPILARFEDLSTVDGHGHPHVRLSRDGPRIIMRTNERHVRMRQLIARIVAVAAVLAGLAFVPVSLWGIALAMAGFGAFALIPRFVRVSTLLRIDLETGEIVALQRAASPGAPISIEYVRSMPCWQTGPARLSSSFPARMKRSPCMPAGYWATCSTALPPIPAHSAA